MESSFEGFVLDPSKCSKLSMDEKRELIYEISNSPSGAPEMLQSWSRREILEILCAEMGKERKYTGLTKYKLIQNLLQVVSDKKSVQRLSPANSQRLSKRQRKSDNPLRFVVDSNCAKHVNGDDEQNIVLYCKNAACRAVLHKKDRFCKRCSCCICYKYDDNKDTSLWLVCNSDPPNGSNSCGMSCHLDCTLKHDRAGILESSEIPKLDGSYYCLYCGKVNDLLGCWRKQLVIAKEARRVDVLCYRIANSYKLLNGTKKYEKLFDIIKEAANKLESEIGPLNGLPVKMGRGIVNRLSSGSEVQKLCVQAIALLDSMLFSIIKRPDLNIQENQRSSPIFRFDHVSPTSINVISVSEDEPEELWGYYLWHRKVDVNDYPIEPTCTLTKLERTYLISDLVPDTEYLFKVLSFGRKGELAKFEEKIKTLQENQTVPDEASRSCYKNKSNPSLGVDLNVLCSNFSPDIDIKDSVQTSQKEQLVTENGEVLLANSPVCADSQRGSSNSTEENQVLDIPKSKNKLESDLPLPEEMSIDNGSNQPDGNETEILPLDHSDLVLPAHPSKLEFGKFGGDQTQVGSSSKKRTARCLNSANVENNYEYCVKIVRWLECQGFIQKNFRVKFLTWFSLKANAQERKIVSVFVDTLVDDPSSLAGQLIDTFSEGISSKRAAMAVPPRGFCLKLWH